MQTEIHEITFKFEKNAIFTMHVLNTRTGCPGSLWTVFGDVQNPAWQSPEQSALAHPALNGETGPPEVHSN